MLKLEESTKVYLLRQATDMRRGYDRLAQMVEEHLSRNALDGALYVFISRDRKRAKILHWERDGYWLHYKRLETSTFRVRIKEDGSEELTGVDLKQLLQGVDLRRIKLAKRVNESLLEKRVAC